MTVPILIILMKRVMRARVAAGHEDGMSEARDGDEIGAIMKEYRKNIPPAERLAVTWTLGEIAHNEAVRLVNFVKANDPGWTFGKQFDKSIFDNYVSGGIDLKV